jgi:hypothetical protein
MEKVIICKIMICCLVLSGCANGYYLHIQTYPNDIPKSDIGNVDIRLWRYSFDRFWSTINYDLKNDIMLYKDSVKVCYKGHIKDAVFIDGTYRKNNPLKLSNKGRLCVRFYYYTQQYDTVIMYTKNAICTSSGVLPIDSVRFIQGEPYKFKDYLKKKKGQKKYGYYKISL